MKFSLFSKSDSNFNLLKVSINKEVNDAQYNSGLWVLAIVAVSVIATAGITLGLFSQLFDKSYKYKDKKIKEDKKNKG